MRPYLHPGSILTPPGERRRTTNLRGREPRILSLARGHQSLRLPGHLLKGLSESKGFLFVWKGCELVGQSLKLQRDISWKAAQHFDPRIELNEVFLEQLEIRVLRSTGRQTPKEDRNHGGRLNRVEIHERVRIAHFCSFVKEKLQRASQGSKDRRRTLEG